MRLFWNFKNFKLNLFLEYSSGMTEFGLWPFQSTMVLTRSESKTTIVKPKTERVKRKAMYVKFKSCKSVEELEKDFNFWYDLRASFIFCKHYQPKLHPGCPFFGNVQETAARLNAEVKKASAAWRRQAF